MVINHTQGDEKCVQNLVEIGAEKDGLGRLRA